MSETSPTAAELKKATEYAPAALAASSDFGRWLEIAALRVSRTYFGASFPYALSLVACHVGTIDLRNSANGGDGSEVGSLASKSEGGLSVSFSAVSDASGDDGDFSQTTYGRQYLSLMRSMRSTPNLAVFGG